MTASAQRADEIFLEWTSLIGAPFHSHEFERMLADLLETRGGTNRFSDLPRPLYIGATGDKMLEMAGEICDGVVLNYVVSVDFEAGLVTVDWDPEF